MHNLLLLNTQKTLIGCSGVLFAMKEGILYLQRFDIGREFIKLTAMITMTIDHLGAIIYPEFIILRIIGRLSLPLYSYLIVLGIESTRNTTNYFVRLFLFAVISQVPYCLAFGFGPFESLNIFFTLSFGVVFIIFLFPLKKQSLLCLLPILASFVLNFDYGLYGIALIGCMFVLKTHTKTGIFLSILLNGLFLSFQRITTFQILSLFAFPIILLHKSGVLKIETEINAKAVYLPLIKYFFYVYYPLHLTLFYLIKL